MNNIVLSLFLALSLSLNAQQTTKPKYVILFGVDGMGGYAFPKANTPNINKLMQEGSYTFTAKCVMPSSSSQNWASMIMGAPPEDTNIPENGFSMKVAKGTAYCGRKKGKLFPSIYTILHEQNRKAKIVVLHQWLDYRRIINHADLSRSVWTITENRTARKGARIIKHNMPTLLFMHYDHVDHAGHAIGHDTPAYYDAVHKADSLLGVIVQALKDKGIYDETAIIVTADHGGKGKGHGGPSLEERNIPWIIKAPGVKMNHAIVADVQQYDTAATLAYLLGLKAPECWKGRAVMDAFEK